MSSLPTYALGIELQLLATAERGRETPLVGGHRPEDRFSYRPNWGLPGTEPNEQAAAPVLGFSRSSVAPGESARAVIVPSIPDMVESWGAVSDGTELPMYEAVGRCGTARVLWRVSALLPLLEADEARFVGLAGRSPVRVTGEQQLQFSRASAPRFIGLTLEQADKLAAELDLHLEIIGPHVTLDIMFRRVRVTADAGTVVTSYGG